MLQLPVLYFEGSTVLSFKPGPYNFLCKYVPSGPGARMCALTTKSLNPQTLPQAPRHLGDPASAARRLMWVRSMGLGHGL